MDHKARSYRELLGTCGPGLHRDLYDLSSTWLGGMNPGEEASCWSSFSGAVMSSTQLIDCLVEILVRYKLHHWRMDSSEMLQWQWQNFNYLILFVAPSSTCSTQFHMFRPCPFQWPELKSPKASLSPIQNIQTNKKAGMLNNTWESVNIGLRGVYFHAYSEFMFTFIGNICI